MTGFFLADWAIFAVSLFNASLLLWLGLTVILNAERRTAGVWALGGSMLLGAAFFISHTAILDYELTPTTFSLEFWWRAGWMPVIASPFAWYAMMLWYAGYWSAPGDRLRRRQRPWFVASAALGLLLLLLIAFAGGLPSFIALTQLDMTAALTVGGLPILFALYPVFMLMCIVLSVDALLRPAPSERLMGDLARARTRPWLLGATLALLFVALLVSWFIGGAISTALAPFPHYNYPVVMQHVAWYDLAIESLIGLAILLIGQAIVSYEVFTGKTLPRRGFSRLWRSALMLSLGYAVLVGGSLVWGARLFYSLLLTTLLMVAFLAMSGWRSFVERDRFMAQLRPFVSSDHRLDRFLGSDSPDSARAHSLFAVLCRDVLDVGQGQLAALGGTAQLVGDPLVYPLDAAPVSLPPDFAAGAGDVARVDLGPLRWAVPLHGAYGPIGTLLLGEKQDGALFAQEEIEIAQASAERIIDMLAGEEISRRLLALQRRRLAETQVLDHRTRRELHDVILPDLHAAILDLSAPRPDREEVIASLSALHDRISRLIHVHPAVYFGANGGWDFVAEIRRMVDSEFAHEFTSVRWVGDAARSTPGLTPLEGLVAEVGFYAVREAVRNAAVHGRGADSHRPLSLTIALACGERLRVIVQDDGVGWAADSNTEAKQGGLLLHRTLLAAVGGNLAAESEPGSGTTVTIELPPQTRSEVQADRS